MNLRRRACRIALLLVLHAGAASAEPRSYDSSLLPGDQLQLLLFSPGVVVSPAVLTGHATLSDSGSGTVTLDELTIAHDGTVHVDATIFLGPGAFVFADQRESRSPAPFQTGSGSATAGASVSWGLLAGWRITGSRFCLASPASKNLCIDSGFPPAGQTEPPAPISASYDLGTWSFDAAGNYEATPYIHATANGGLTNFLFELRGRYVGASLPALPVAGLSLCALALIVHARRLLGGRNEEGPGA